MKIRIIETGELKELKIIDPETGVNWVSDLIGQAQELGYDDEAEIYTMTQENFEWWADLVERKQAADDRVSELKKRIPEEHYQNFISDVGSHNGDLDDEPGYVQSVCDQYEQLI